jgi:hypothetical protein
LIVAACASLALVSVIFCYVFSPGLHMLPWSSRQSQTHRRSDTALVLIAHDREEYLRQTLESLRVAERLDDVDMYLSMDKSSHYGSLTSVTESVLGPTTFTPLYNEPLIQGLTPQGMITVHHSRIFETVFKEFHYDFSILLETDLTVSPDFISLFLSLRESLSTDPSLLCASAWNDNGLSNFILDESRMFRTDFFPGLGWMVSRRVWETRIRPGWPAPTLNWNYDWAIREQVTTRGLDCLVPEVPRTHHISKYGTHVNGDTHVYDSMRLATGEVRIEQGEIDRVSNLERYEEYVKKEIIANSAITTNITHLNTSGNHIVIVDTEKEKEEVRINLGLFPDNNIRGLHKGLLIVRPTNNTIVTIIKKQYESYWLGSVADSAESSAVEGLSDGTRREVAGMEQGEVVESHAIAQVPAQPMPSQQDEKRPTRGRQGPDRYR